MIGLLLTLARPLIEKVPGKSGAAARWSRLAVFSLTLAGASIGTMNLPVPGIASGISASAAMIDMDGLPLCSLMFLLGCIPSVLRTNSGLSMADGLWAVLCWARDAILIFALMLCAIGCAQMVLRPSAAQLLGRLDSFPLHSVLPPVAEQPQKKGHDHTVHAAPSAPWLLKRHIFYDTAWGELSLSDSGPTDRNLLSRAIEVRELPARRLVFVAQGKAVGILPMDHFRRLRPGELRLFKGDVRPVTHLMLAPVVAPAPSQVLGAALGLLLAGIAVWRRRRWAALLARRAEWHPALHDGQGLLLFGDDVPPQRWPQGVALQQGPVVVLGQVRAAATYRETQAMDLTAVLPGTADEAAERLDEELWSADAYAIAAVALLGAPLWGTLLVGLQ